MSNPMSDSPYEASLKQRISEIEADKAEMQETLDNYKNGYKGSCWCCERVGELNVKLEAENKALREAAQAVVDFVDGPKEAQRPDVFHLYINRLRTALTKGEL